MVGIPELGEGEKMCRIKGYKTSIIFLLKNIANPKQGRIAAKRTPEKQLQTGTSHTVIDYGECYYAVSWKQL